MKSPVAALVQNSSRKNAINVKQAIDLAWLLWPGKRLGAPCLLGMVDFAFPRKLYQE
jgi:hypothetical protein